MHRAEAGAFALSNNDVLESLRRELRLRNRALRLSSLPVKSATDVLTTMQAVEAIRSYQDAGVKASKLPTRLINEFYTANDFLIEFDDESDNRRA